MIVLFDTMTGAKREFIPIDSARVTLWACGPTIYSVPHLGNARTAIVFDMLFRVLQAKYPKVLYARNITDIDQKIEDRAKEEGVSIHDLTERTIAQYESAMETLGLLKPTFEPRVTENIPQIIEFIETLLEKGFAYEAEGHVLFEVSKHADHGKLSGQLMDALKTGTRIEVASYKRDPSDFVLWKPSDPDQPGWESPWGRGRCGWHIECSSMIASIFDNTTIDIHGGGNDLMFPHHEAEIAQSECRFDVPLANYWVHSGMLTVTGAKMAKSAGNFITVPDALLQAPAEVVRYALLSGHYRQPLDWSPKTLKASRTALDRLYRALEKVVGEKFVLVKDHPVRDALEDDLNTPVALAELHAIATKINQADPLILAVGKSTLYSQLVHGGWLLGLLQQSPEAWFHAHGDSVEIEWIIARRETARKEKRWADADAIRLELTERGITLEDTPDGTLWRIGVAG